MVVGAGAVGSATAWWLARWGIDVVLLEQFEPGHRRGSSHGSTRIFRIAYPDRRYISLAREALPLWRELEDDAGVTLLETTGGIDYGAPASLQSIVDAVAEAGVDHQILDPADAHERWPGFAFSGPVLHQPDAGRVLADAAVRTLQARAETHGARVRFGSPVVRIRPDGDDDVWVDTAQVKLRARRVVVAAGAWVRGLLEGLVELPPLNVTREQVFHFPAADAGDGCVWPSFIHHGETFIYGLQAPGSEGVKVAEHHTGAPTTADQRSYEIDEAGRQRVVDHVARLMPGLEPVPTSAATCLYTNTPDESFIVERRGPIVVGSACSGHGFKFVPLTGRRLAELAVERG